MKSIKLLLSAIVLFSVASCTSVTDANIDGEFSSIEDNVGTAGTDAEDVWNTNGDDMDPIIDEPPSGGWN